MISSQPPALEIDQLRKSYGDLAALQGVTFDLAAGERLAFLGPNGAGKTTLIRCLAGRTKPTSGQMHLLGRPLTRRHRRLRLGLVPQEIAVYRDLTTTENLWAFGRLYGLSRSDLRKRVDWAIQWTGLSDRAHDLVGGFSGGMKRRVNLACGVLHNPRVLLLDEPTVGVDPQSRERIFEMLDALHAAGTSILLTTHHLDEAQQRSDRIVIMDQGSVVADGDFNSLVAQTVGPSRLVRLRLQSPITSPLRDVGTNQLTTGKVGDDLIETRIDDVSVQLRHLLQSVSDQGCHVTDVEIQSPSLHHVFLHLTGHELRD
ncbi:ABC transporter ATP-binding protein [Stieleria marina]|uniref:ABC transporter ATP-binding protein n=1 Tax=Stieleria marina TaxID=1930275 RepID=UPI003AF400BC